MCRKVFWGGILLLSVSISLSGCRSTDPMVHVRAWQFHTLDTEYVTKVLELAQDYEINTVVYSHDMIWAVSDLYDGTSRCKELRQLADQAHEKNLKVWLWIHELEHDVPKRYLTDGKVHLDRQGFWDWLNEKYEKLFQDFPEFDGLLLTFHETEYKIFRDSEVSSELSMPERFANLINTIDEVCAKYSKDLVVRSFLYEPQEIRWFEEGLRQVSSGVMLQAKCVPHDWQPYYPHNHMIGRFSDRKLIVEYDGSSEFTGRNQIPWTSPEYFEYRWRYAQGQPGVVGYNVRLDHGGYDALYSPNEINIYSLYRLSEDQSVDADEIWTDWTNLRYGEEAGPIIEKALKPTFDAVNKALFPLKFWITNHSKLPGFRYADGHISSRTLAKWIPEEPIYQQLEDDLNHPDEKVLAEILMEKDEAIAHAKEALEQIESARSILTEFQYLDLKRRLELLHRATIIWEAHSQAFFGYKVLAEGHEIEGLRSDINQAIHLLYLQAEISENDPWVSSLREGGPGSAVEIRKVADELASLMADLKE